MLTKIRDYILHQHLIEPGETVQVGVSGGADSVCLLHVLSQLRSDLQFELEAVHVNHNLRSTAHRDEVFTSELCQEWGIPCRIVSVDVMSRLQRDRRGVEAAARQLRYEAFAESGAQKTALAHHMQDQAETVLMNLIRGSGTKGLAGMLPKNGCVIRPLLCCSKSEILGYMQDHGLQWVEDETNQDVEFTRNGIRHQLVCMIEERWNPNFCESASQTAAMLQQDEELLSSMAKAQYERLKREKGVHLPEMAKLPPALASRVARLFLEDVGHGRDMGFCHIQAILEMAGKPSGSKINLPGGLTLERSYDILQCYQESRDREGGWAYPVGRIPCEIEVPENKLKIRFRFVESIKNTNICEKLYTKWIDYDTIKDTLQVRTRRPGDYISAAGGRKKLQDYFIDEKIPRPERDRIPLLADGPHVLWIIGYRLSDACKIGEETKRVLEIDAEFPAYI